MQIPKLWPCRLRSSGYYGNGTFCRTTGHLRGFPQKKREKKGCSDRNGEFNGETAMRCHMDMRGLLDYRLDQRKW